MAVTVIGWATHKIRTDDTAKVVGEKEQDEAIGSLGGEYSWIGLLA